MSNLLIVESHNDKYFIEALVNHINVKIEIDSPVCSIDDYECLGGMDELAKKLRALKSTVEKHDINKIGIILDADCAGKEARTQYIQEKIKLVFEENSGPVFFTHILNIDGQGELETLLKAIKSEESPMADCLDAWQQCLSTKNKALKQKDFDKFWINIYQRYDCCSKQEQNNARDNCNNESSLKKPIYDFDR